MRRRLALLLALAPLGCASAKEPESAAPPADYGTAAPCQCHAGNLCRGWVVVRFDVATDGSVSDSQATKSCPAGRFDDAAAKAVSDHNFGAQPRALDDVELLMEFPVEEAPPADHWAN